MASGNATPSKGPSAQASLNKWGHAAQGMHSDSQAKRGKSIGAAKHASSRAACASGAAQSLTLRALAACQLSDTTGQPVAPG
jgi:hypothetical protein